MSPSLEAVAAVGCVDFGDDRVGLVGATAGEGGASAYHQCNWRERPTNGCARLRGGGTAWSVCVGARGGGVVALAVPARTSRGASSLLSLWIRQCERRRSVVTPRRRTGCSLRHGARPCAGRLGVGGGSFHPRWSVERWFSDFWVLRAGLFCSRHWRRQWWWLQ